MPTITVKDDIVPIEKQDWERIWIPFDFTERMATGVNILGTPVVTVQEIVTGANVTGVMSLDQAESNGLVSVLIGGGANLTNYRVNVAATFDDTSRAEGECLVKVINR